MTDRSHTCFQQWINLQQSDLDELVQSLNPQSGDERTGENDSKYSELSAKTVSHFEDYMESRTKLAREDISHFFAPSWCTTLENSLLWIAGCRPSMFIRLIYALCGCEIERSISQYLQSTSSGLLFDLSAQQLSSINTLHLKTVKEEEKLTSLLASLQEDIADQPLAAIAREASQIGETSDDVEKALDDHEHAMADILEEADKMRLKTLKELLNNILTPKQGVEFLAASKKLHLSLHEWGKKRDQRHGRSQDLRKASE
ncbi:hypothetical protein QQ045_000868 [Rhodiola kirilowii]